MAKRLTMFALRLMLLNFISIFVTLILSLWDNTVYQWAISAFVTFLLWLFVWMDSVNIGQKDVQKDKIARRKLAEEGKEPAEGDRTYKRWFGFAAGILAQVPAILLLAAACVVGSQSQLYGIFIPIVRAWYFTYAQLMVALDAAMPYLIFVFPVLFAIVSGLAYLNGPNQQRRLETIIERNKTRKAKRVQDDLKSRKRGGAQRKPDPRRE